MKKVKYYHDTAPLSDKRRLELEHEIIMQESFELHRKGETITKEEFMEEEI